MNPSELNLRGYTVSTLSINLDFASQTNLYQGFIWGTTALLTFIWAFFRLPETKDRSFEELDIMFAKEVPTRKFRTFQVDAFNENITVNAVFSG